MSEKNNTDRYVEYIKGYILPFIDYYELQDSCDTDMIYAKGILNRLHEAMVKIYGGERLGEHDGDKGFVLIPGVVRGIESGKLCLAFLELDLSSSGEHYGTTFLCSHGPVVQAHLFSDSHRVAADTKALCRQYMPYDYCYTADISGDIHIDESELPKDLKAVLKDFRNHKAELLFEQEELPEKPSTLDEIKQSKNKARRQTAAPKNKSARKKSETEL